jgi:hypothetical protein
MKSNEEIREFNRLKMAAWRERHRQSPEQLAERRLVTKRSLVRVMSEVECAYMAGLIDSDGGVFGFMKPHKPSGKIWPYAALFVTNSDIRMIDWVMQTTGCGSLYTAARRDVTHIGDRQMYRWDCGAQMAAFIAEQIRPYVILKGAQLDLLMELSALKRSSTRRLRSEPERQVAIIGQMQTLNRERGKTGTRVLLSQIRSAA